jgi:hypothetical protein
LLPESTPNRILQAEGACHFGAGILRSWNCPERDRGEWRRFVCNLKKGGVSGSGLSTNGVHPNFQLSAERGFRLDWQRDQKHFPVDVLDRTPVDHRNRIHWLLSPTPTRSRPSRSELWVMGTLRLSVYRPCPNPSRCCGVIHGARSPIRRCSKRSRSRLRQVRFFPAPEHTREMEALGFWGPTGVLDCTQHFGSTRNGKDENFCFSINENYC